MHCVLGCRCCSFETPSAQAILVLSAFCTLHTLHTCTCKTSCSCMSWHHFNVEAGEKDYWGYLSCRLSLCQLLLQVSHLLLQTAALFLCSIQRGCLLHLQILQAKLLRSCKVLTLYFPAGQIAQVMQKSRKATVQLFDFMPIPMMSNTNDDKLYS